MTKPRNATEIGKRRNYVYRDVKYPSVTTLLKGYPQEWAIGFGAKWAANRAVFEFSELARRLNSDDPVNFTLSWLKSAPAERRDAAADHGTDLHGYLERRLRGASAAPATVAESVIEDFLAAYRPEPVFIEAQVVNVGEGYAGSFDAIVDIYGRRFLLDLKTAGTYDPFAERPTKAGGDHKDRLQLAAYRYADIVFEDDRDLGPMPKVDACLILAVPRDHPEAWQPLEVEAGPEEYRRFLDFSRAWRWYDQNKDSAIGTNLLPQVIEETA